MTFRGGICLFARPIIGVSGSIGLMWLSYELTRLISRCHLGNVVVGALAKVGTCTLGIYLLHQWILARIVKCFPSALSSTIGVLGVTLGLTLSGFLITWLTQEKCSFTRKWIWGK